MIDREIIPPSLAIASMRDSGYRDAAHALAELVDNAVEATAGNIEILCTDKIERVEQRQRRRIDRIAVLDNGKGMAKEILHLALQFGNGTHLKPAEQTGIGKFGMGLPNSSISQCQRVDVWTWQDQTSLHSYLDVEEIQQGKLKTVPVPQVQTPPKELMGLARMALGRSGTLIVWSQLDRVRWRTSKALLENSELLIGRIYRHFLDGDVSIRLAAFSRTPSGDWQSDFDKTVLPNDPLNLMPGTSCPLLPAPYTGEAMFTPHGPDDEIDVQLPGDKHSHRIVIKYAMVRREVRKALGQSQSPGATPPGLYAARNIGISIVRARRELELSKAHVIGYDPVERWWGIEVSFDPALDSIFGVSNNKQAATNFAALDLDEDAKAEGMKPLQYLDSLKADQDPRWAMYEISRRIHANLLAMRGELTRMSEGSRTRHLDGNHADPAEIAATKVTAQRRDEGHIGQSDSAESKPAEQREEEIAKQLEEQGTEPQVAREIAIQHVSQNIKYVFQDAAYQGPSFFSVASRGGAILVTVNKEHPVSKLLLGLLENAEGETSNAALTALKLMLCAWGRLEDESRNDKLRQQYVDVRDEWGRMTRQFLMSAYED
jgi:Histidine kinase-, DNA gyrase B-, and HSP90-like ATPase